MIFSLVDGRADAWQWDTGLSLNIDDSEYQISEVHMSNSSTKGAFVCEIKPDRTVEIPNILLTTDGDINIYAIISDEEGERTVIKERLHVHRKKKPQDYVYTETEVYEYKDYITRLESVENTVLEAGNVYTLPPDEAAFVNVRVSVNEDNSKTYYIDFYIPEGQQGEQGIPGVNGTNGKTPYIQNGYWYIDGVNLGVKAEGKDGTDGTDGTPGKDGTSVTITRITESTASGGTNAVEFSDGSRLNVRNGKDGKDGEDGAAGAAGADGADGVSPTITTSKLGTVTTITITDKNGTKTAKINDGTNGTNGTPGKDGTSVSITRIAESTASGGTNTVEFSDGNRLNVRNGKDGYTPVKTVDYFTEGDKEEIKSEIVAESVVQGTGNNTRLVMSQDAVTRAIEAFTALPYGGSKEWLEINGDKAKLYQIGGYVWGYVDSEGWTKSDVQFRVVRGTFEMTDTGGIPYLSCPTGATSGAVYKYTEASGDIGVPVYDSKPTTANEGDIIAVGERKYKASLTSKQVPTWKTNYAKPSDQYWLQNTRLNSSNTTSCTGMTTTNYIDTKDGDIVRVANINLDANLGGSSVGAVSQYLQNNLGTCNSRHPTRSSNVFISEASGVYSFKGVSGYLRFCGVPTNGDENVIITINEEISYNTETTVTWTDIGAYTPPTEAGWSATDEVYNVIDSLDVTASNGESAVYRADGFLYSFVGGSDWVQMSKYEAPTIAVDGELSDSSTNAVQNKIVTKQFNDIHSKVNKHTNELSTIKDQLGNIATVPSFWQSAVDACIAKIKVLQKGRNCVTFPFFSDNHTRDGKTQYMGILIAHIMKECGIPYCFCGGDVITSAIASTADSDAEFKAQAKAFDEAMSYVPDGRMFLALGNHETYLKQNTSISGSTTVTYDRNQQYEIFLRNKLSGQNAHLGGDGTYYYVNDIASKVRWIVLNTNGIGDNNIDSTQLSWFENTALKFNESGWGVVIISHIPISNHYEQSSIGNNTAVIAKVKAYMNGSDANKASIIGWYSGHIHRDRIYSGISVNDTDDTQGEDMGFKQVTITSDHTSIAYPIGNSPTYHPVADDALSHAIDFVTINKDLRQVNITRLGIGEDRSYTY